MLIFPFYKIWNNELQWLSQAIDLAPHPLDHVNQIKWHLVNFFSRVANFLFISSIEYADFRAVEST